ncbi:uncharacterized protein LOC6565552 [Drosophila grimshawi]|uniref:GH24664 n=1 Tax=Drosophila grimshawi TaxID=7222 RepID=B4JMP7_DROGR|nr:uncharacterized protein LOC6565552 [Drosophila grimshawi]EDV91990.1 GH24664 [Drosophila grimshawi]
MADEQQQQQQQQQKVQQEQSCPAERRRRRAQPMPPDNMIRNSIASSLTQIIVNMQDEDSKQKCRELLQVDDLIQGAHIKILTVLEQIDLEREQRERAISERRHRRSNQEN